MPARWYCYLVATNERLAQQDCLKWRATILRGSIEDEGPHVCIAITFICAGVIASEASEIQAPLPPRFALIRT